MDKQYLIEIYINSMVRNRLAQALSSGKEETFLCNPYGIKDGLTFGAFVNRPYLRELAEQLNRITIDTQEPAIAYIFAGDDQASELVMSVARFSHDHSTLKVAVEDYLREEIDLEQLKMVASLVKCSA